MNLTLLLLTIPLSWLIYLVLTKRAKLLYKFKWKSILRSFNKFQKWLFSSSLIAFIVLQIFGTSFSEWLNNSSDINLIESKEIIENQKLFGEDIKINLQEIRDNKKLLNEINSLLKNDQKISEESKHILELLFGDEWKIEISNPQTYRNLQVILKNKTLYEILNENSNLVKLEINDDYGNINGPLINKITTLLNLFRYEELRSLISNFITKNNNLSHKELSALFYYMSKSYILQNNYTDALKEIEKSYLLNSNSRAIIYLYAEIYSRYDDLENSEMLYLKALGNLNGQEIDKKEYFIVVLDLIGNYVSNSKYELAKKQLDEVSLKIKNLEEGIFKKKIKVELNNKYAGYFAQIGDYDQAYNYCFEAIKIYYEIGDTNGVASMYLNLGYIYNGLNKFRTAINYLSESLNYFNQFEDSNGLSKIVAYRNLSISYYKLNQNDLAIEYIEKAIELELNSLGLKSNKLSTLYNDLGNILSKQGKTIIALEYYEKALKNNLEHVSSNPEPIAINYLNIANELCFQANYNKAFEYYIKGETKLNSVFINKTQKIYAELYSSMASCYMNQKKYSDAINYFELSLDLYRKYHPEENNKIGIIENNISVLKKKK